MYWPSSPLVMSKLGPKAKVAPFGTIIRLHLPAIRLVRSYHYSKNKAKHVLRIGLTSHDVHCGLNVGLAKSGVRAIFRDKAPT